LFRNSNFACLRRPTYARRSAGFAQAGASDLQF
jgi:hypothetical protein